MDLFLGTGTGAREHPSVARLLRWDIHHSHFRSKDQALVLQNHFK